MTEPKKVLAPLPDADYRDYGRWYDMDDMLNYASASVDLNLNPSSDDAGQYAIQVLARKIESLTAARDSVKEDGFSSDTFVNWHQDGMIAGLQIAIDALRLEIPFVKLERGPLFMGDVRINMAKGESTSLLK